VPINGAQSTFPVIVTVSIEGLCSGNGRCTFHIPSSCSLLQNDCIKQQ